ncbi:hypothetical protein ACWCL1_08325 [Ligilactobacillus sp. LYQ135]
MIFTLKDLQTGETCKVSSYQGLLSDNDEFQMIDCDVSDDVDELFGKYTSPDYWINLFNDDGLSAVNCALKYVDEVAEIGFSESLQNIFTAYGASEGEFVRAALNEQITEIDSDLGIIAENKLADSDASIINNRPYVLFFDYEGYAKWLLDREIEDRKVIKVNNHYYRVDN